MDDCGRRPRRRLRALLWILLGVAWVACGSLVPRQGWSPDHGPVVPHDTFPADCSLCHVGDDWHTLRSDFTFDHAAATGTPLHGAHRDVPCLLCHNDRGPVQRYAARGCGGCHVDPHRGQLGGNCADCHDERDWRPRAAIAEHARTRMPLVGAHAAVACFRCHPGAEVGNFAGATPDCVACHGDDLQRATLPDHAALGLTDDCQRCHVPLDWRPARFAHPASFPLTGGHRNLECSACHRGGTFQGLSRDCVSCHDQDWRSARDPDHMAAGFGSDCESCHGTATFAQSTFQHPLAFPLGGGHAGRRCVECHRNEVYAGTSAACVACHLPDYQAARDPEHASAGFPTDCQSCHGTNRWQGASFQHRFPITSGDHRGLRCSECHTTPGNLRAFSCIDCHEHRQSEMADEHRGVAGYVWASPNCLQCHPDGRER